MSSARGGEFLIYRLRNECVQCLMMRKGIDGRPAMAFRTDTDVETALVRGFGLGALLGAGREIIIHSAVKILHQFGYGGAFIGDEGADPLDFAEEDIIAFGKLHTPNVALIFQRVILEKYESLAASDIEA